MNNRILMVKDHPRLLELYEYYCKIQRLCGDHSWGGVFGTPRNKVLKEHQAFIVGHFRWKVRNIIGGGKYDFVLIDNKDWAVLWSDE